MEDYFVNEQKSVLLSLKFFLLIVFKSFSHFFTFFYIFRSLQEFNIDLLLPKEKKRIF